MRCAAMPVDPWLPARAPAPENGEWDNAGSRMMAAAAEGGGGDEDAAERFDGAIIVGAGPAGLAAAACLDRHNIPYLVFERSSGIAPLWRCRTYDRLRLHTPAQHCSLPYLPFPRDDVHDRSCSSSAANHDFPTRALFLRYLQSYAASLLRTPPVFGQEVVSAEYDKAEGRWLVRAVAKEERRRLVAARWLVVASGENAAAKWPGEVDIPGLRLFPGLLLHSALYKNPGPFARMHVLVVGAGNSGMEIALDLCNCPAVASTSLVVRSPVHILPREMFGMSTFAISMALCKILPIRFVDRILVAYSQLKFGDTSQYGLKRPKIGPLELKNKMGKTPILDVGAFQKIQNGAIKVKTAIDSVNGFEVCFVDNTINIYDAIILATGYKSTVPTWLKEMDNFLTKKGQSRWTNQSHDQNGNKGLYTCGLSGKGLIGASADALYIAQEIKKSYFSHTSQECSNLMIKLF